MSISYVTTNPMTVDQAIRALKQIGCTVDRRDECYAVVKDTNGNYFHLTDDIGSYRTLSFDLVSNAVTVAPTEIHDGTSRVMGECYGRNDATAMAHALDMVCEFQEEYHAIMGGFDEEQEEEDDHVRHPGARMVVGKTHHRGEPSMCHRHSIAISRRSASRYRRSDARR